MNIKQCYPLLTTNVTGPTQAENIYQPRNEMKRTLDVNVASQYSIVSFQREKCQ